MGSNLDPLRPGDTRLAFHVDYHCIDTERQFPGVDLDNVFRIQKQPFFRDPETGMPVYENKEIEGALYIKVKLAIGDISDYYISEDMLSEDENGQLLPMEYGYAENEKGEHIMIESPWRILDIRGNEWHVFEEDFERIKLMIEES